MIVPDFILLVSTVFIFTTVKKLSRGRKLEQEKMTGVFVDRLDKTNTKRPFNVDSATNILNHQKLMELGNFSSLVSLCVAGAIKPSVINGVYFVAFLIFSTWLALNREFGQKFGKILRIISCLMALHIAAIILYQMPWIQDVVQDVELFNLHQKLFNRLMGFSVIYTRSGDFQNNLELVAKLNFDALLQPFVLIVAYFITMTTSMYIQVSPFFPQNSKLSVSFVLSNLHSCLKLSKVLGEL